VREIDLGVAEKEREKKKNSGDDPKFLDDGRGRDPTSIATERPWHLRKTGPAREEEAEKPLPFPERIHSATGKSLNRPTKAVASGTPWWKTADDSTPEEKRERKESAFYQPCRKAEDEETWVTEPGERQKTGKRERGERPPCLVDPSGSRDRTAVSSPRKEDVVVRSPIGKTRSLRVRGRTKKRGEGIGKKNRWVWGGGDKRRRTCSSGGKKKKKIDHVTGTSPVGLKERDSEPTPSKARSRAELSGKETLLPLDQTPGPLQ